MITGGTSGIGRAAAIAFAREGARVTFCGRRKTLGAEVEQSILASADGALFVRRRAQRSGRKGLVDFTVAQFGRIDVALNNAGITLEKSLHEYSSAEWDNVLNTNLRGVFFAMKYQFP